MCHVKARLSGAMEEKGIWKKSRRESGGTFEKAGDQVR
jgi:hypothetical protein